MYTITSQTTAGTNVRQFKQPDPLLVIERAMRQMIDTGQAMYVTIIATDCDGRQTEITVGGTEQ